MVRFSGIDYMASEDWVRIAVPRNLTERIQAAIDKGYIDFNKPAQFYAYAARTILALYLDQTIRLKSFEFEV